MKFNGWMRVTEGVRGRGGFTGVHGDRRRLQGTGVAFVKEDTGFRVKGLGYIGFKEEGLRPLREQAYRA